MNALFSFISFLTAFILSETALGSLCPRPLQISVAESWPPAVLKTLERYREPFKELGCKVVLKKVPLSRSMLMVSKGQLDGDTFRIEGFDKDFPHVLRVQTPMARFGYYLYKKRNTAVDINNPKSLAGHKTCLTLGNRLRRQVAKELKLKVTETTNTSQCLKMLTTERVDVFFGPRPELEDPSLQELNEQLIRAEKPYMTVNLYIYLNDKHSELAKKLEQILDKYFVAAE